MAYVSNMMHVSMSASVSITGTVAVTVLPSVPSATRAGTDGNTVTATVGLNTRTVTSRGQRDFSNSALHAADDPTTTQKEHELAAEWDCCYALS